MRRKVYISGPISLGHLPTNVQTAVEAGLQLLAAGFAPLIPHLTCYANCDGSQVVLPRGTTHDDWIDADLPWVAAADGVLRLPGESLGADREVERARSVGIPVFGSIQAVLAHCWHAVPQSAPDPSGDPRFHAILTDMARLHAKKAADYGAGDDPLANLRASAEFGVEPWLATLVRMNDKVTRLKSFAVHGRLANEGAEDSLMDLAAYAILVLILFRESREGEK